MKLLDKTLFDSIEEEAKASPRHRMNYDLRTQALDGDSTWRDNSQRMLNVMLRDMVIPIHRHSETSETVIILRGSGDADKLQGDDRESGGQELLYTLLCA